MQIQTTETFVLGLSKKEAKVLRDLLAAVYADDPKIPRPDEVDAVVNQLFDLLNMQDGLAGGEYYNFKGSLEYKGIDLK